jgi:hypothetical protein
MAETKTASEQLADAQKQQADLAARVDVLLKQTHDEDLATVKRLIQLHKFTATDLRTVLKTTAAAKKAAATKSISRRKAK